MTTYVCLLLGLLNQPAGTISTADAELSARSIGALQDFLQIPTSERPSLQEQPFARVALTKTDAKRSADLLWQDHVSWVRRTQAEPMQRRELQLDSWRMRFDYQVFGQPTTTGRSLYLSMHGGGNAPPRVNDRQWENQKRLYEPAEGIYLAPRAPSDTWDLWHRDHIDPLFDRLIDNLIVLENVDPNRVYLMGYSAGGDGVYQLAPRIADRLAAAAMMAGHPNETSPLGLRNLPFTIHMGALDEAYNRNRVALDWQGQLDALQQQDPRGYVHWVKLHEGKGHWMDHEDAAAVAWMAKFQRNPFPERVVWKQDDVVRRRFYWLAINPEQAPPRSLVVAERNGQQIHIISSDPPQLTLLLHDTMLDLDQPVEVWMGEQRIYQGHAPRTIAVQSRSLAERGDPQTIFAAELTVTIPQTDASADP